MPETTQPGRRRRRGEGSIYYDRAKDRWTAAIVTPDGGRRKVSAVTRDEVEVKLADLREQFSDRSSELYRGDRGSELSRRDYASRIDELARQFVPYKEMRIIARNAGMTHEVERITAALDDLNTRIMKVWAEAEDLAGFGCADFDDLLGIDPAAFELDEADD